jgi:hypothetical protein
LTPPPQNSTRPSALAVSHPGKLTSFAAELNGLGGVDKHRKKKSVTHERDELVDRDVTIHTFHGFQRAEMILFCYLCVRMKIKMSKLFLFHSLSRD